MTRPPRPAPAVRVSDPRSAPPTAASGPPPDASPSPAGSSRACRALLALLVGLAVVAGGLELRSAQQERAAAGELALELYAGGTRTAADGSRGSGPVLRHDVALRNLGQRPVQVLGAELVGSGLSSRAGPPLPPGSAAPGVLTGRVRCDGGPVPGLVAGLLRVRARTDAGQRTVDLPVPAAALARVQAAAERACARGPVGEVQVRQVRGRVEGAQLLLDVALTGPRAEPVALVRADPALPGLRVGVGSGGTVGRGAPAVRLRSAPGPGATVLRLVVSVADCDVLRRALAGSVEVLESALLVDLVLVVGGRARTVRSVADDGGLPPLLSAAC